MADTGGNGPISNIKKHAPTPPAERFGRVIKELQVAAKTVVAMYEAEWRLRLAIDKPKRRICRTTTSNVRLTAAWVAATAPTMKKSATKATALACGGDYRHHDRQLHAHRGRSASRAVQNGGNLGTDGSSRLHVRPCPGNSCSFPRYF